ncbi:zinc-binding metallopeptidase family protein [Cyclobacterium xiamenense]|uniref:zinc-binding metallopeptidase family protein n=1 Tax=Cyclobacterium xiamenense TaxID=1297121 RepID=UPI0012B86DD3|nr:putative zinc-binding peptidase [Cyclobacterium xiamenense]
MKLFQCSNCRQSVYFENTHCTHCQSLLGFDAGRLELMALQAGTEGLFRIDEAEVVYRYCENERMGVCNWLIPLASSARFCRACSLNRVIPDLSVPAYKQRWKTIEQAKHRLVYALLRWNLPFFPKAGLSDGGLGFDFKASQNQENVLTGHASGIITMNIAEADDVERAMAKKQMDEVYRTVLGHFRHETGHYFWDVLVAGTRWHEGFRELFGDEREPYTQALEAHYQTGPPVGWQENFISAYASAHPWEDWAETWAHYLHLVDTLETAYSFGLTLSPRLNEATETNASLQLEDGYTCSDFSRLLRQWVPLSLALNSLNRSMGLPDSYPFVISKTVAMKMEFVHELIRYQEDA